VTVAAAGRSADVADAAFDKRDRVDDLDLPGQLAQLKHWRTGRWRCGGRRGMVEAGKQFRRVNGHLHAHYAPRSNARFAKLTDPSCKMTS
jgi:hypothetical protein